MEGMEEMGGNKRREGWKGGEDGGEGRGWGLVYEMG
jgi:hypothetical protein